MAMNTRHWCLRKLESAKGNLDWTGKHLFEVHETYKDQHPEIAEVLASIMDLMLLADEMIDKIKEKI